MVIAPDDTMDPYIMPAPTHPSKKRLKAVRFSNAHRLAIHYYLGDPKRDPAAAWKRAIPPTEQGKMTTGKAKALFNRMMKNPPAAAYMAAAMDETLEAMKIDEETVLREWGCLAFYDPIDYFDSDGRIKGIHQMSKTARKAISSVEVEMVGGKISISKIKFESRRAALDSIAKHLAMFKKVHEVRMGWLDDASTEEKLQRRRYIEAELEKRGIVRPVISGELETAGEDVDSADD